MIMMMIMATQRLNAHYSYECFDVACSSVCLPATVSLCVGLLVIRLSSAKKAELIEMPFGGREVTE